MCVRYAMMACICAAGLAVAGDLPARKSGLWEITRSTARKDYPASVQQVCLDAETNALLYKVGVSAGNQLCSKVDVRSSGDKIEVDAVCKFGSTTSTAHIVTTLAGDTAYHEDAAVHYEPPLMGKPDVRSSADGKWIGECMANMKPGDIWTKPSPTMPIPMKMNIRDALKNAD